MSGIDPLPQPDDHIMDAEDALTPILPASAEGRPPLPSNQGTVPPAGRPFPLHPNFWWAVLWCIAMVLLTQIPGAIVMVVIIFAVALVSPATLPLDQLQDTESLFAHPVGQISMAASIFVAHGLIICFALLLLRIIAGRDWPRQVALRLPSFSHVCMVLVVAPAFMMLADGFTAALTSKYFYVPSVGDDLPGTVAFLLVLSACLLLFGVACLFVYVCGIKVQLPLAGQIVLALVVVALARFPTVWAYESLREFFASGFLGKAKVSGMQQMESLFTNWPIPLAVFAIGVMPGLSEELWCRAFLGRGLVGKHGLFWGVLGTAFLFGAIHVDPRQGTMAVLAGVMLHYVYLTTRSLLLPMLLHFLNNSMAVTLARIPAFAEIDQPKDEVPWGLFAGAALLLAAVVWTLYQCRARLVAQEGRPAWQPPYPGVALPPPNSGTVIETPLPSALSASLVAAGLTAFVVGFVMALR